MERRVLQHRHGFLLAVHDGDVILSRAWLLKPTLR